MEWNEVFWYGGSYSLALVGVILLCRMHYKQGFKAGWEALRKDACTQGGIDPDKSLHHNLHEVMQKQAEACGRARLQVLESYAAAYLLKVKIPPDEAELVEEMRGDKMVWYFRKRV